MTPLRLSPYLSLNCWKAWNSLTVVTFIAVPPIGSNISNCAPARFMPGLLIPGW